MDFSFAGAHEEGSRKTRIDLMLDAAFTGNLNRFKMFANELNEEGDLAGTIISCKDDNGCTALHLAALGGRTRILKYLLDEVKLDVVNIKGHEGETALHCAIEQNHFSTAVFLIENGANLNAMNEEWVTPLHLAAMAGHKKLLQLLISKGAEVDANPVGGTPLQRAAAKGKKDSVKILLDNHANPNISSIHTYCPLLLSIIYGSIECVKLLLKAGADPNDISKDWTTPLECAVSKGDIEIVKCLLNAGADSDLENEAGMTPIEVAAKVENRDAVMTLFPVTSRISDFSDWSVNGIMKHIHSKEMNEKRKQKLKKNFLESNLKGKEAVQKLDFNDAVKWYTKAINCNEEDGVAYSNRSLCWARLSEGYYARKDAFSCVLLNPFWPKAYYRLGAAWMLLKDYEKAADAFNSGLELAPNSKELEHAYREAVEAQRRHG